MDYYVLIGILLSLLVGFASGAVCLWYGIRVGVNLVTRPESFRPIGEKKMELDESTV